MSSFRGGSRKSLAMGWNDATLCIALMSSKNWVTSLMPDDNLGGESRGVRIPLSSKKETECGGDVRSYGAIYDL